MGSRPPKVPLIRYLLQRLWDYYWNAHSIYFPVHIILFLVRFKKFKKDKLGTLFKSLKGYVYSVVFATLYAIGYSLSASVAFGPHNPITGIKVWALAHVFSSNILFESRSRWGEMSIYVFAQWIEALLTFFKKMKIIPETFPYVSVSSQKNEKMKKMKKIEFF